MKFEHWLQEIRGSNSLNGGIPIGLCSGLISQADYESGYPFIYVDLSRRASQANDDISRSIQIVGQTWPIVPSTTTASWAMRDKSALGNRFPYDPSF